MTMIDDALDTNISSSPVIVEPATPVTAQNETSHRFSNAQAAYTTKSIERSNLVGLTRQHRPRCGDVVLAKVVVIGHSSRLDKADGQSVQLSEGDEVIVVYGHPFSPAQSDSMVPSNLGPCDLVSAGGVAVRMMSTLDRGRPPTSIMPMGLVTDADGNVVNLLNDVDSD